MSKVYELTVQTTPGDVISYHPGRLADALGIADPNRLAVETNGASKALVTIYPKDPLARVLLESPEQLLMDARGRIWVGVYHNGRRALLRLYDPGSGSAQRLLLFGTTGAGKSTAGQTILAAMKRSGIAVMYADLKGGQSAPEAYGQKHAGGDGNTCWNVTTQEGAMAQLRSTWKLMMDRQARYAAMGRSKFLLNRPDPLVFQIIDEANRLLEKGAPYRAEATFYIKDIGRTGRSLGIGIGLFAQAGHLEEMGGSDTLRSMLKEGEVCLLRWTSSIMKQLVTDGLLPAGQILAPIPKYAGVVDLVSQFAEDEDDEDLPGTQGTAYIVNGRYPTSKMRYWSIGSSMPTEGLDPLILDLYGTGKPTELEEPAWDTLGEAYTERLDGQAAFDAAFADLIAEAEAATAAAAAAKGGRAAAPVPGLPTTPAPGFPGRPKAASLTAADRVKAVLETTDEDMGPREVLEAVNADGGRTLSLGTIKNVLSELRTADC